jgi:hypothetical protein
MHQPCARVLHVNKAAFARIMSRRPTLTEDLARHVAGRAGTFRHVILQSKHNELMTAGMAPCNRSDTRE